MENEELTPGEPKPYDEPIWYKREDGREYCVERTSASALLMSKDANFVRIDGPQGGEIPPDDEVIVIDLGRLSRDECTQLMLTVIAMHNVTIEELIKE